MDLWHYRGKHLPLIILILIMPKQILDEDHYGLKEIKDRIFDFISIRKLKTDGYAPILCFVGPPGTGKTSLGQSIARAWAENISVSHWVA